MLYKAIFRRFLVVTICTLYGASSQAQCGQLIWSDEFNGAQLDQSKWKYDLGNGCPNLCGWGNAEIQDYTSNENNIRLSNGLLEIEARNDNNYYSSAKITTKGLHSWKYGRFEMRAKLPSGTGLWPAFWMLPVSGSWPMTGELDIMENRGDHMTKVGGTLHYGSSFPNNQYDGTDYNLETGTFESDFHVFAVEWEEGEIRWFVDNELYKTETSTPNSLNPTSTDNQWPWDDQEFYIIVNLAIGGNNTWYTGGLDPDFGNSGTMQVDYVRVYDSPVPTADISGKTRVYTNDITNYSTNTSNNVEYTWSVPTGATITQGQGTNNITIDWGSSNGGDILLDVEHISGSCTGNIFAYTYEIEVFEKECEFFLENFDENAAISPGFRNGQLNEVNNPMQGGINSSIRSGKYERNSTQQYDVIIYENALLDGGNEYTSGTKTFQIDVYTSAPIGTPIQLQLTNSELSGAYPLGVHSLYSTETTVQNEWETLTFSYDQSPDPSGNDFKNDLNRIILLFNPDSYTNDTYYFDNLKTISSENTSNLVISGNQQVDENATGITYTASGGSVGSTYSWSLPSDASITAGNTTSSILVDFGILNGTIAVTEQFESGCSSELIKLYVQVGDNDCILMEDEFEENTISNWATKEGEAGFTNSQSGSEWTINSTGHDEWAYINYTINDGDIQKTLDFTIDGNEPIVEIKVKATSNVILRATLVDEDGTEAANNYLSPLNALYVTTDYQTFNIDFTDQLWDEWNGGGALDQTKIHTIKLSLNPGWVTFPETGYANAFIGDVIIDYIKIGKPCTVTGTANDLKESASINLFPNPFTEQLTIDSYNDLEINSAELISPLGEVVQTLQSSNNILSIDSSIPKGIYLIRINTNEGSFIKKIIKQ